MLLLTYRSLAPDTNLPHDQRWRTIEIDDDLTEGLDVHSPGLEAAIIHRVNEGKVPNVPPIPYGVDVHLVDTDAAETWSLKLKVEKA